MPANLLHTLYLALAYLVLFAAAEWLYHYRRQPAEVTRKLVHIVTGLLTMLFPLLLSSHWYVLLLCGSFLVLLMGTLRFGWLQSVNGVARKTWGSLLFPVIVYGCFLAFDYYGQYAYYYLPILILSLCDPVAALVGKRYPHGRYRVLGHTKTLSGSLGFWVAAMVVSLTLLLGVESLPITQAILLAVAVATATAIAEGLSHTGYDNLTIPAAALGVLMVS